MLNFPESVSNSTEVPLLWYLGQVTLFREYRRNNYNNLYLTGRPRAIGEGAGSFVLRSPASAAFTEQLFPRGQVVRKACARGARLLANSGSKLFALSSWLCQEWWGQLWLKQSCCAIFQPNRTQCASLLSGLLILERKRLSVVTTGLIPGLS